jgi:hypothetical protein
MLHATGTKVCGLAGSEMSFKHATHDHVCIKFSNWVLRQPALPCVDTWMLREKNTPVTCILIIRLGCLRTERGVAVDLRLLGRLLASWTGLHSLVRHCNNNRNNDDDDNTTTTTCCADSVLHVMSWFNMGRAQLLLHCTSLVYHWYRSLGNLQQIVVNQLSCLKMNQRAVIMIRVSGDLFFFSCPGSV